MVEIIIEIENAVIVIMIITNHLVTMIVATAEPEMMTANSSRQKRRSIHISNAKRKIRMPLAKTACSGMDSNGSRKHKGNMILSNQILLYRKTRKASRKPRREWSSKRPSLSRILILTSVWPEKKSATFSTRASKNRVRDMIYRSLILIWILLIIKIIIVSVYRF